ncbi:DNA/RNA non-specific endonuclease [Microbacterium sp. P03]|uniref:DNA/RNA non-specific endonuclease n=1 Tax=Microbacterium sp. P03 TaxID=3366946 RepID=UPI00374716C5
MIDDALAGVAAGAAALPILFALVLADSVLVVVPGEIAVTAFAALSITQGTPPLAAVIVVAAAAALTGDIACYVIGRRVGTDRWRWMRRPRVAAAFGWARHRLHTRSASVLFTARFIPFARLAVNLTAGAGRMHAGRYLLFAACAALVWAMYQAFLGALIARLLPDAPALAVIASVAVALALGAGLDALLSLRRRREVSAVAPAPEIAAGSMTSADSRVSDAPGRVDRMADIGYDPAFLGLDVPLPVPGGERSLTHLDYLHFTVTLDRRRRLAAVTGVMIDGETLKDLPRTGDWDLDDRVPASEQAGPDVYRDNDLDRGHLVRRRDPGWGDDATARRATEQTFFYPNASPQASGFNQSPELWLGLEDHVLAYAGANRSRVCVFTAPVLADDDPAYRGLQVPRRFWKVAVWRDGDDVAAAGFLLDQTDLIDVDQRSAVAVAPLEGFRTFQVSVAEIAEIAEVDFGVIVGADVLALVSAREEPPRIRLRQLDQVRLGR